MLLVSGSHGVARTLLAPSTGRTSEPLPDQYSAVSFSRSAELLATSTGKGVVSLWDTSKVSARSAKDTLQGAILNADGTVAAIHHLNGEIGIVDTADWRARGRIPMKTERWWPLEQLSPDGRFLITIAGVGVLQVWSCVSGAMLFEKSVLGFWPPSFSPDSKSVLLGSSLVKLSDHPTETPLGLGPSSNLRFTPDGKVIVALDGGNLLLFDADHPHSAVARIPVRPGPAFIAYSASADSKLLAVEDGSKIDLIDWERGRIVATIPEPSRPRSLIFRPGGGELLGVYGDQIKRWDLAHGNRPLPPLRDANGFRSARFRPIAKTGPGTKRDPYLVTVGADNRTLQLWNIEEQKKSGAGVVSLASAREPVFSFDGGRLLLPHAAWLQSFWIGSDGLILDRSLGLNGEVEQFRVIEKPEEQALCILSLGSYRRLVKVPLDSAAGQPIEGNAVDLLSDFQSRLNLKTDDKGAPTPLHPLDDTPVRTGDRTSRPALQ